MQERIAIVEGVRTPFCKASGVFNEWEADDLGAMAVRELLARIKTPPENIDELIFGNVMQPPHATNIARVLAVKGGLPVHVPAFTVNRNCASGMEAITTAASKLLQGDVDRVIAGGVESMTHFPVLFKKHAREWLMRLSKAKTFKAKLSAIAAFRPSMLAPEIPAIADPLCGMTMGQTAEVLAREFHVTRQEQDQFALMSQQRAKAARDAGYFLEEIIPVPIPPHYAIQDYDDGIRETTAEKLATLYPVFDRLTGTVTAASSSQVTDGAVALLLMRESTVKEEGIKPLGYLSAYSVAALEPHRMGLGPAFAIAKLLEETGKNLKDFDLFEINEAFAAQVLAVVRALESKTFAKEELGLRKEVGTIPMEKLNVNGGAIALGHPVGASGARLVLTLLKELQRKKLKRAIASLCVGGGQGEAVMLEVNK